MRGKGNLASIESFKLGITPAYAGKSYSLGISWCYRWDHPRLCGEKYTAPNLQRPREGSPPPMRGKVIENNDTIFGTGITPAYAGKSRTLYAEAKNYKDHPRLCGEKQP